VRDLGLSPGRLEQLTRSVSEAVHNAMAQQHRFQMELPLLFLYRESAVPPDAPT
jgi:hypothetical protein